MTFSRGALTRIIREYTHEAGVRNLEREIAGICRKVARQVAEGDQRTIHVNSSSLPRYLGPQKFFWGIAEEHDEVGVATGVARTEMGGDVLGVEVTSRARGRPNLASPQTALRSRIFTFTSPPERNRRKALPPV
jgi:ATP-dependent Lon protease